MKHIPPECIRDVVFSVTPWTSPHYPHMRYLMWLDELLMGRASIKDVPEDIRDELAERLRARRYEASAQAEMNL